MGLELLLLAGKLIVLLFVFWIALLFSFVSLWSSTEIGKIEFVIIWVSYYLLAFALILGWPFYKYVYSRFSKQIQRRLLYVFVVLLLVAVFVFFVYPVRERFAFEVKKKTFVTETNDTIWNKLFRGKSWMPDSFFRKVRVTIYADGGKRLGEYSVNGHCHYTRPYQFYIADDGTPFIEDGGEPIYFTDQPRPRLKYSFYEDTGVSEWIHRFSIKELNRTVLLHYTSLISKDFELIFEMPDFQCPTNHVALAALDGWVAHHLIDHSDRMVRYAEHIMNHCDIMTSLPRIWSMPGMDSKLLHRGLLAAIGLAEQSSCPDKEIMRLLGYIMGTPGHKQGEYVLPDDVIRLYANHANDMVSSCALVELTHRAKLREIAERLDEQRLRGEK